MATATCSSSTFIVRGIAAYVKDITFGRYSGKSNKHESQWYRLVDGNKNQIIKADGKLEEFCGYCNKDEDLKFVPEISVCGQVAHIYDVKTEDQKNIGTLPVLGLGRGWSDDNHMSAFTECFEGTKKFYGGSKAVTLLNTARSFEEIQRSLSSSAKVKAGAKFFAGSAESDYEKRITDTQFTQSFYFLQKVQLPTAVFQPKGYGIKGLNDLGKDAYDAGPEQFRKICGNRLITEVHQGAELYAAMQIRFVSNYDKQTFAAHSKMNLGGMTEVKASIKTMVQTYKLNGKLEIIVQQIGGYSGELSKVFGKCGKSYCITSCSLNDLDACDGIIGGIISYAQDEFPEQLNSKDGVVFENPFPISYTMPELSDVIGLAITPSVVTDPTEAARKFFKVLYTNQTEILNFVEHALAHPEEHHIPGAIALKNLEMAGNALRNNMGLIESTALNCYSKPSECEKLEQEIIGKLVNVTLVLD